jgi:cystathionine beta-synthase
MRERGFLREEWKTLGEAVQGRAARPLVTIGPEEPINNAIVQFKRLGISQLPVHDGSRYVGSLTESHVITALTSGEGGIEQLVRTVMGAPFPSLSASASLHDGVHAMGAEFNALIVSAPGGDHIVSKHDLLAQLA